MSGTDQPYSDPNEPGRSTIALHHRPAVPKSKNPAAPAAPNGPDVVQVGPYRVLRRVGQGSMGVVYQAEQREPIRRVVALKLVKSGMDTEEVVARFEAERQALALMDHPNVAKVFDAGATPEGRPYFAMEYAPGVPITDYCRDNRLGLRDRLRLFLRVCDAVQHAHQKGIIHRDLKPGNILVTMHDGRPTPKVIDFGIVKATAGPLTDRSLATAAGRFMGTPAYMSPEQADTAGMDVDTRTDVYSLGVVLYELLAGCMPFDPDRLSGASQETVARIIRETDPPRPSTRLSAPASPLKAPPAPSRRSSRPPDACLSAREVRGDLDWIVLKALEKDRTRRYDSPGALAADIRRHLVNEPVLARPPNQLYRMSRFARRHRLGVTAAAAVLAALVLGAAGAGVGFVRARAAQAVAEAARFNSDQMRQLAERKTADAEAALGRERAAHQLADREARKAADVSDFMLSVFAAANPDRAGGGGGRDVKVADLLDRALDDVKVRLRGQPAAATSAYLTLAKSYEGLGIYPGAEQSLRLARDAAALPGGPGAESEEGLDIAARLAWVWMKRRNFAEAEALARPTLDAARARFGDGHRVTQYAANALGCILLARNRQAEGEAELNPMLEPTRRAGNDAVLSTMLHNLALSAKAQGRLEEAERLQREAVQLPRAPSVASREGETLAEILAARGKQDEARQTYAATLAEMRPRLGDAHPDVRRAMAGYAALLERIGEWDQAVALLWDRLQGARSRHGGADHPEVAGCLADLAELLSTVGRRDDAARYFAEAIPMLRRLHAKQPQAEDAEAQRWWRFAALRAGLGRPNDWASPALRAQVWCALDEALEAKPTATFATDEISWTAARVRLVAWGGDSSDANTDRLMTLAELASLPDPPAGAYLLAVGLPRTTGEGIRLTAWLTFAPWQVALYPAEGIPARGEPARREQSNPAEAERRVMSGLALVDEGLAAGRHGFGPRGTGEHFVLAATARLRLPPGGYTFTATSDDGVCVWVDPPRRASPVIDAWRTRGPTTDPADVELTEGGEHLIRVEYFQAGLGSRLWVRLAPRGPAADAMAEAAMRGVP